MTWRRYLIVPPELSPELEAVAEDFRTAFPGFDLGYREDVVRVLLVWCVREIVKLRAELEKQAGDGK